MVIIKLRFPYFGLDNEKQNVQMSKCHISCLCPLIDICTDETHHFLLRLLRTIEGVVQVGIVRTDGVDDDLGARRRGYGLCRRGW